MYFNAAHRQGGQGFCRGHYIFVTFARQSYDNVYTNVQASSGQVVDCIQKLLIGMAPVDGFQGFVVDRLQAKFDPDVIFFRIACQKVDHFRREAVRPCADGQADHIFLGQCFIIERFQFLHRCISIGKGLEISDKFGGGRRIIFFAGKNLIGYGGQRPLLTQLRAAAVAVNAAAGGHMPVAVGTGKARVDLKLVDGAAEQVAPVTFQIVISFIVFPEIRFGQSQPLFCVVFFEPEYY